MRISAALIVKNEESCLKSIQGRVDEIVICDTGSTDRTLEIAGRYTDKIFTDYKWEDHFAKARNHALSKCTGDWIFSIDADEIALDGCIEDVRSTILANPGAFAIGITCRGAGHGNEHVAPRFYKRCKEVYWEGAAHNHLSRPATISVPDAVLVYGYSAAHKQDPDRTLRILTKAVAENPDKPRELFYLAREYYYRKNWLEAIKYYEKYIAVANWLPEKSDAYLMVARCYWEVKQGDKARKSTLLAIEINPNFKEALAFMAEIVWPQYRDTWLMFAELATEESVLFRRKKPELWASYYQSIPDGRARYVNIYDKVADLVGPEAKVLDIGCGKEAPLKKYFKDYDGFDFTENPIRIGNAYTENYEGYTAYIALEVLEHLDDLAVLERIPAGKGIVFSVPSFHCQGHLRVYTKDIVEWRYRKLVDVAHVTRYNWDSKNRIWVEGGKETKDYILLCVGIKK